MGDRLAKQALNKQTVEMRVRNSKSEAKVVVWKQAIHEWQRRWDTCVHWEKFIKVKDRGHGV